ncbi:hypothetical protein ACFWAP_03900 [Streptomyces goshikiensis]|uniref:hypothetical protein n=1 Tax=Streptomyces goshikiensis TaxID=1942 RepID=UPI00364BB1FB
MTTATVRIRPVRKLGRGECPVCTQHRHLKDGKLGMHLGMALSGALTGERCPGVGEPPVTEETVR